VCEENPNATFADMSTIMGDKWKNVSEDERKPYEDRYKVEKDIYLKVRSLSLFVSKLTFKMEH
jgi:upstream-binding transcription factor